MDKVKQWLEEYGLRDKEITLFLEITKTPHIRATELQRLTGYVRTSLYYSLNQLVARGLVAENIENNIRTFSTQHNDIFRHQIQQSIQEKEALLERLTPIEGVLSSMKNTEGKHSSVVRYEGEKSIMTALEAAFRCESKQWHVIAAKDNFLAHVSDEYKDYYLEERKNRHIKAKTLWEPLPRSGGLALKDIVFRSPRELPNDFLGAFNSLVIIYDDSILIIDDYHKMSAHIIKNVASAQLFRLLFMTIWKDATPIK